MIYFSIIAGLALLLNIVGRLLILSRDQAANIAWRRGLLFCPGVDAVYLLFRWQNARVGCALCASSLVLAAPVAHQLATGRKLDQFTLGKVIREMIEVRPTSAKPPVDLAALRKLALAKEKQLFELNKYLQKWFESLTAQQGALNTENTNQIAEYNRAAGAYQNLMKVWKAENGTLNELKARIARGG